MLWLLRWWREWRTLRRLDGELLDLAPPVERKASESLLLDQIAYDLRRLINARRYARAIDSEAWLSAVLRAYDQRLQLACRVLGVPEHLEPLEGIDRELERLRVESLLNAAGAADVIAASIVTMERDPASSKAPPPSLCESPSPDVRHVVVAARLVQIIVLLLPSPHRVRYGEEFSGELYELAEAGATCGQQLLYGVRLVVQVWVLRKELRSPEEPAAQISKGAVMVQDQSSTRNRGPQDTNSTRPVWVAVILLAATIVGIVAGFLAYVSGMNSAGAALAGGGAFSTSVLLLLAVAHYVDERRH